MRAREPDVEGFIERDGVKVGYEVFGNGSPTLLLLPAWSIVSSRMWKAQVAYLARHHRVITFDPRGNGRSDRPTDPQLFADGQFVEDAVQVLDATDTEQVVLVALSRGNTWAVRLAADHPSRVLGWVAIGAFIRGLQPAGPEAEAFARRFDQQLVSPTGWELYNRHEWLHRYRRFAEFFFHEALPEPHSTKQWEDAVGWALDTDGETLVTKADAPVDEPRPVEEVAALVRCPVVVVHGTDDEIRPYADGKRLAELTGARLVTLEAVGHLPQARYPVLVNRLIHEFAMSLQPDPPPDVRWRRSLERRPRVLYLSSPIGLGHARRDLAIVRALRERRPDAQVEWLTQHPVTAFLRSAGESVHPASDQLASESRHLEGEAGEHDLHVFQAFREMDEVLVANFMVLDDLVREEHFDLVVGDEAWDLDYFLHENPELKNAPYAWLSDFVGYLPLPEGGEREAFLTADYNAEMLEQIARHPHVRDRAIFVGEPGDIVDGRFGPDLPEIRPWVEAHFAFSGHITGFEPLTAGERAALRRELGWGEDELICLVAVGGSGVGSHLLQVVLAAEPAARRLLPALRMVGVCGPRIDPSAIVADGIELHGYVDGLHRWLDACDIGVVQGGLTTTMELVAAGRPFLFFPLERHFEQQLHVAHRLARHGAGRRMEYATATTDEIAQAIAHELRRPFSASAVTSGGAGRAAALIAPLLGVPYAGAM